MPNDCIFCAIVAGDIPARKVDEDDRVIAFMDISPATRGHTLVIPRVHAKDLFEIDPDDLAACAQMGQRIAGRAVRGLGADGVNLLNSSGPQLSTPTKMMLAALMFAGRLGPITVASAVALRRSGRQYAYPVERPIIG